MKYLVAKNIAIARYWAEHLGLIKGEWRLINRVNDIRELYFKKDTVIFIEGEKFDYAPPVDDFRFLEELNYRMNQK